MKAQNGGDNGYQLSLSINRKQHLTVMLEKIRGINGLCRLIGTVCVSWFVAARHCI
jgi:hypothetical protein